MRFWCLLLAATPVMAQDFTQRGFLEMRFAGYPQAARNDDGRAIGEALLRYEAAYKLSSAFRFFGSFDAQTDSHRQAERDWDVSFQDRSRRRPAFAVRRLSVLYHRSGLTIEAGKQFIRWGKADVLNPTDRFAPRDFLSVVDNEFLGVTAARATWEANSSDTIDLVYVPVFTPSRTPLLNQRWVVLPEELENVPVRDAGSRFPGGPQFGVRWNHIGAGFEHSLSYYEGFNHLPLIDGRPEPPGVAIQRLYPKMRMYGGDAAAPLRWFTLKGEAAWFTSSTPQADEYIQYVFQLERQSGEWFLVGGYAGEIVTVSRNPLDFAPDRGLARAFLGRAGYTIDVNRSLAFEGAVRQNGEGVWLKFEYSQSFGRHWRATAGFALIRGSRDDFLGQYRRNSHGIWTLRYSL